MDFAIFNTFTWQIPYQEKWKLVLDLHWVASPSDNWEPEFMTPCHLVIMSDTWQHLQSFWHFYSHFQLNHFFYGVFPGLLPSLISDGDLDNIRCLRVAYFAIRRCKQQEKEAKSNSRPCHVTHNADIGSLLELHGNVATNLQRTKLEPVWPLFLQIGLWSQPRSNLPVKGTVHQKNFYPSNLIFWY